MTFLFIVVVTALVFEYINGFHDTANSIATVVATKVLTPRQAVVLAACTNLIGALWGTAVAKTIASGLIDPRIGTQEVLICALAAAIVWNLITWSVGLPSSSSHTLVGGLVGAAVAAAGSWSVVIWSQPEKGNVFASKGLLWKVIVPMVASPLTGFVLGVFGWRSMASELASSNKEVPWQVSLRGNSPARRSAMRIPRTPRTTPLRACFRSRAVTPRPFCSKAIIPLAEPPLAAGVP